MANLRGQLRDKPLRDAIRMEAIALGNGEEIQHPKGSWRAIAQRLLLMATAGDIAAIREAGDRIEGRPAQAIVGSDEHPSVTGWKEWMEWLNPTYRDAMFRGDNSTATMQDESDLLKAWPTDGVAKQ